MPIHTLRRCGVVLFFVVLVSGCASSDEGFFSSGESRGSGTQASSECRRDATRCIYKGRYEQGERAYAEREAKRLNHAQLERLRRMAAK